MADTKITALTALTAADPANDVIPIVDVSDTTMAASGTTKKISINNILSSSPTASGALTVTGLVTAGSAAITGAATVGTTLGVTGVSTLASAVVTGALAVDTTTLVANAAGYTDKVGIGTATPSSLLTLNQASGAYSLNMDGGGYGTIASFGIVNVGVSNDTYIGTVGNNDFLIRVANSTRATFDQSGHFNLANGNVVMATSGKGIDFSATSNSSGTMTSELLNDYEEGTFVPTVGGSTSNGTATYSTQTGVYTKIGRIVQIQIFVAWSAGTAIGSQTVLGLPFAAHATANNFSILNTYPIDIALTAGSLATSSISPNGSAIDLYQLPTGGGPNANVPCDAAGSLLFTGTYTAA